MGYRSRGFTLVEVVVAILLLVVGVLALVGSSAMAWRMIGQGRQATMVAQVAAGRLDWLRHLAGATWPPCIHPAFASGSAAGNIGESWVVPDGGIVREVTLALEYRVPRGLARDTLRTAILCR